MDDDSDNLAFRRVVVSVAERLTEEEVRKLIYIRLYSQREALSPNPQTLEVLATLEQAKIFGPTRPEGLLDILEKDLKNRQLANLVRVFIKNRKVLVCDDDAPRYAKQPENESDSRLRMCYKMAISQANVLVRHLEALRVAAAGDGAVDGAAARAALDDISEAAVALARLNEKANLELLEASALCVSAGDEEETKQPDYEDMDVWFTEEAAEPLPSTPVSVVTPATLPLPPPPRQQKPSPKPKPPLKPKPKLNNPNTGHVATRGSPRSLPRLGFNNPPSRPSSLPELLEDAPEDGEENEEDDYISPEQIEDETSDDYDDVQHRRNSKLLKKTTSLPHISDSEQLPGTSHSFRPLPAPRRMLEKHQQPLPVPHPPTDDQQATMDRNTNRDYTLPEPGEEYEPIYDDIVEHTLLSRMAIPRPSSSSSSSSD